MCDAMCVASETGSRPHFVSETKKGGIACDEGCVAWKSQRFCPHTLAVAEETSGLDEFLAWYRKLKVTGNYTAVICITSPRCGKETRHFQTKRCI